MLPRKRSIAHIPQRLRPHTSAKEIVQMREMLTSAINRKKLNLQISRTKRISWRQICWLAQNRKTFPSQSCSSNGRRKEKDSDSKNPWKLFVQSLPTNRVCLTVIRRALSLSERRKLVTGFLLTQLAFEASSISDFSPNEVDLHELSEGILIRA